MRELTAATILALHSLHLMLRKNRAITANEIHDSTGFAPEMVRAVLGKLRRSGAIRSRSGHGYVLARAPGEITLLEIVRAIGEPQPPTAPCGGDYEACDTRAACILAPLCRETDEGYRTALRSYTLAELMAEPLELPNCLDPKLKTGAS
jgi:Rrf2 family protein